MSDVAKKNLAFIYLKPPLPEANKIESREHQRIQNLIFEAEKCFEKCGENAIKVGPLAFLLDLDECQPEFLEAYGYCKANDIGFMVAEVGESPVSLAPTFENVSKFLQGRGHRVKVLWR